MQAKFWAGAFVVLAVALTQVVAPDAAIVTVFGGVILALAGLTSTGSKVLSGRIEVYLGEISYSVYMVCFPWLLVYGKALEKVGVSADAMPLILWLALFAGVVPLAALSHHLIEKPARSFLRRWADRNFPLPLRPITRPA